MEYTEKERRESAEAALKILNDTIDVGFDCGNEHFAKFNPPDPDKELKDIWRQICNIIRMNLTSTSDSYKNAESFGILATQARLNEVRRGVLDEFLGNVC